MQYTSQLTMLAAAAAPRTQVGPRGPRAALPDPARPSRLLLKRKEGFPSPADLSFPPGGGLLSRGANTLPCYG